MKIFSALLGIHIMFLVTAPSFEFAYVFFENDQCPQSCSEPCEEEQCSSDEQYPGDEQYPSDQKNNCCNMACNPFMFCCNCYALVSQSHKISASFTYSSKKYKMASEAFHSYFLSETWKPPRAV